MTRLTLLALALGLATSAHAAPDDLGRYQWKSRVLVIFADPASPEYEKQNQVLSAQRSAFAERDLVVLAVDGKTVLPLFGKADGMAAEEIRSDLKGPAGKTFQAVLVGKDGLVKLRKATAVSGPELFGLIDSMPMRANEARKQTD
jgi:hypothetical protein